MRTASSLNIVCRSRIASDTCTGVGVSPWVYKHSCVCVCVCARARTRTRARARGIHSTPPAARSLPASLHPSLLPPARPDALPPSQSLVHDLLSRVRFPPSLDTHEIQSISQVQVKRSLSLYTHTRNPIRFHTCLCTYTHVTTSANSPLHFGFRVPGSGFQGSGFGFGVWGSGFGI